MRIASITGVAILALASVASADPIAHWTFDTLPKTGFPDFIGQRIAVPESPNAVTLYAGDDAPFGGKAVQFNGQTGSALSLPNMGPFFNKNFTLAAWMLVHDGTHPSFVFADWPTPNYSFSFGTNFDNKTKRLQTVGEMRSIAITKAEMDPAKGKKRHTLYVVRSLSDKDFTLDTWHHVAWVYNRTSPTDATLTTYLDGVQANEVKFKPKNEMKSAEVLHNGGPIKIGLKQDNNLYFNGAIDELWLFDSALTPAQVTNLMHTNDINKDGPEIVRANPAPKPPEPVAVVTPKPADPTPTPDHNPAPPEPVAVGPTPTPPTPANDAPDETPPAEVAPTPAPAPVVVAPVVRPDTTTIAPVKTVAVTSKYTTGRIAGIVTCATLAMLFSSFLFWAKGERAKLKGVR